MTEPSEQQHSAAARLAATFDPEGFPGFTVADEPAWTSQQVRDLLTHHRAFLRQTIEPDVRDVLQQLADANAEAERLFIASATERTQREAFQAAFQEVRTDRDRCRRRIETLERERDEARAEVERLTRELGEARKAIRRTCAQMEEYQQHNIPSVNVRQVVNLLSPTWPDGNYAAADDATTRADQ